MDKILNKFKRENGFALAMTILVLAVLVILSVVLLGLSLSETTLAAKQSDKKQAYYLARSGAEAVAIELMKHSSNDTDLFGRTSSTNTQFSNGSFTVAVESLPTGQANVYNVRVTGTGTVDGVQSTASVLLYRKKWSEIGTQAIYSNDDLHIDNMKVHGHINSGKSITYSHNGANAYDDTKYKATPNSPMELDVDLPDILPPNYANQDLNITTYDPAHPVIISTSGCLNSITIGQQGRLLIDGSGEINIVVNTITINNILEISDDTMVNLYVRTKMDIQTKGLINNTYPKNLNIIMLAGSVFDMQANIILNGYITGPDADIIIQSNNSTINGFVIGNTVTRNGPGSGGPNGAVNFITEDDPDEIPEWMKAYKIVEWNE